MRLKKIRDIQKYSGKEEKISEKENDINSKENKEKLEDAKEEKKEEVKEVVQVMPIDYDELPDGVYDFTGLAELQHRKTRPNLRENEKVLKAKSRKEKRKLEKENLKSYNDSKNIVEEIFEEKKNNEEKRITIEEKCENIEKMQVEPKQNNILINKESIKEKPEMLKEDVKEDVEEEIKIPEVKEEIKEVKNILEDEKQRLEANEQEEIEDSLITKSCNYCTFSKRFAFIIMMILGTITQISFLASSRENNLIGLVSIILCAFSMFLFVNILDIRNKILIFTVSVISVLLPIYNDFFITGENAIINACMLALVMLLINLIFVEKNKIICFTLAVLMFILVYKNFEYSIFIVLVITIIKILKDAFDEKEKLTTFLLHCAIICVLFGIAIFL